MQSSERQLHLRLHTRGAHHPALRRPLGQVIQQHRLAHTGFARHHQDPALTGANRRDQLVQLAALSAAAHQRHPASQQHGFRLHLQGGALTLPLGAASAGLLANSEYYGGQNQRRAGRSR